MTQMVKQLTLSVKRICVLNRILYMRARTGGRVTERSVMRSHDREKGRRKKSDSPAAPRHQQSSGFERNAFDSSLRLLRAQNNSEEYKC